ncbi:uncharacterized protein HaLaN_25519, partial [Haematococcus lacustris]
GGCQPVAARPPAVLACPCCAAPPRLAHARQFGFNLTVHVPPVLHGSSLEYEVWDVCDGEGWDRLMALFPSTPNDESRLMLTLSLLKVKSSAFMTRMEGWHGVWEVAALSLNSSSPHGLFTASTLRALIAAQVASFRGSRQERAGRFAAGAAAIAALWCALRHPHASVALSPTKLVGPQSSLSGGTDATATAKTADTPAALAMDPETPAREDQLLHSFLQLGGMRSLVVSLRDLRALLTDQEACRQLAASARRDHASLAASWTVGCLWKLLCLAVPREALAADCAKHLEHSR